MTDYLVGNVTKVKGLRTTNGNKYVCEFGVAVDEKQKVGDRWETVSTTFYNVTTWEKLGINVADSLKKGDRVMLKGQHKPDRTYQYQGKEYTSHEFTAYDVALSLLFRGAKSEAPGVGRPEGWCGNAQQSQQGGFPKAEADPWASAAGPAGEQMGFAPSDDEPPF